MAFNLHVPAKGEDEDDDPSGGLPAGAAEDGGPFGEFPGCREPHPHAAAYPVGLGDGGPPSFDLNKAACDSDEVEGFNAPAETTNFDLNIDLEAEDADDDADVYADDFHVLFDEEELQWSSDQVHGDQADVFNAPDAAVNFDLNNALEEEELQGSSDEEHAQQAR
ncbi:hypothetical protein ACP4OV_005144 [Aristida adscensionis]